MIGRTTSRRKFSLRSSSKAATKFFASAALHRIEDSQGPLIGFANVTQGTTDRRAIQDALLESERRFRILVQGVTDYAIFMLDPSGRVTNWNAGAERIKGYAADAIVGQHLSRF